jgi:radical SAM superfamily enzyme YgiQ (UPF0313 family)
VVAGLKKRDTIGLVGTMVTDYPWLSDLCETIFKNGGKFSPGSLRIDSLDEKLVGFLEKSGEKTISLAPEAGSERLRKVINKEITDEEILYIVELLIRGGILNLKLYFMIGLPTETGSDIEAIVGLGKKVRHLSLKLSQGKKRIERITLSINPFVPKPSTPFQWHPFEDIRSLKNKLKIIANGLKKEPNLYVTFESPKWSYIQALLSRGDRRVGKLLSMVHRLGGDWQKAFKKVNLNPDFYVYRPRDFDEILPWDFIDQGIKKDYLVSEYHRGLLGASTPKCDTRRCKTCGVC